MRWTENIKRKVFIRWLLLFLILVLVAAIILWRSPKCVGEPFQLFEYPSEDNFHDILHSGHANNYTKLITYEPQLFNKITARNVTTPSNIQVVVIVKSSIPHFTHRASIRQTWASEKCIRSHNMEVYFALGNTTSENGVMNELESKVSNESNTFNDILRFNFIDTYDNNTYKVMAIMDHFVIYHSNVSYLLIIDDDFFLDPSMLNHTINSKISKYEYHQFFGGFVYFHNQPIRDLSSKWYVSDEEYRYEFYPPYATGGFLLISNPMVKICRKLLPYLKYSPIDDVLLGILLFKLKIYPVHMKNVVMSRSESWPNDLLASHEYSEELVNFWLQNDYQKTC